MKTKQVILTLSCLLLFAATGHSEPTNQPRPDIPPHMQRDIKVSYINATRPLRHPDSAGSCTMGFLGHPEFRTALDMPYAQYQAISNSERSARQDFRMSPEHEAEMEAERKAKEKEDWYIPYMSMVITVSEPKDAVSQRLQHHTNAVFNALTPEHKQKVFETLLAAMGDMQITFPIAFEALNLTDTQREEIEKIKRELESEYEKKLEFFAEVNYNANYKILPRLAQPASGESLMEDPEYKHIIAEMRSRVSSFQILFRTRIFDVLTDEQWIRLQDLVDNPPEHAQVIIHKLREHRDKILRGEVKGASLDPDWKPENSIPDAYREERNKKGTFPREKNMSTK